MTRKSPKYSTGYGLSDDLTVVREVRAYTEFADKTELIDVMKQVFDPVIQKFRSTYLTQKTNFYREVLVHNEYSSTLPHFRGV